MAYTIYGPDKNFLGIQESHKFEFEKAKIVIQSLPYEHTSSYLSGSDKGPQAILEASHFVEFYDEETDDEAYNKHGICTLAPWDFQGKVNKDAMDYIRTVTSEILQHDKFLISLGAEHSVTYGIVQAFAQKFRDMIVLQIDAHSDLRMEYQGNPYSHASVMARIFDMSIPIVQVGIRAQCKEEAALRKANPDTIATFYAHQIHQNDLWQSSVIELLQNKKVYVTIDADGFDPSVMPAVGTAEPNGLSWFQVTSLLKNVAQHCDVVGFDILEIAPREGDIITEYHSAKLLYKFVSYLSHFQKI
jgi:agmatinase